MTSESIRHARTRWLDVAYGEHGPADGAPVVLLHGFPYSPRAFDAVAPRLAGHGCRVIVPYLRGYGPTRFLSADTMRSGQQAAIGCDLIDLLDALALPQATLMGFDWGARAAAIVAALHPTRVCGLVSAGGYQIQDIATLSGVLPAEVEYRLWYQTYFNTERGRAGLTANRAAFCEHLWRLWSPSWSYPPEIYAATAAAFDNPDFVDVVIHSYRHRCGAAPGDPILDEIETRLAAMPPIAVPTIALWGADDGVMAPPAKTADTQRFTGPYARRILPGVGHAIPHEAPEAVAQAVLEMLA